MTQPEAEPTQGSGAAEQAHFEDLTLAEALGRLRYAPRETLRALRQVTTTPRQQVRVSSGVALRPIPATVSRPVEGRFATMDKRLAQQFGLRLAGLLMAWWGSGILANSPQRTEEVALNGGAPFLILGFILWLAAEIYGDWAAIRAWWQRRQGDAGDTTAPDLAGPTFNLACVLDGAWPIRAGLAMTGVFLTLIAVRFTAGNHVTFIGFWAWVLSIIVWVSAVAPMNNGWLRWINDGWLAVRHVRWRSWHMLALMVILLLAAHFRLTELGTVAPEMTSDHVEKILDSYNVQQGTHSLFFSNNGGREPFQMYAMSLLARVPGLGMNFTTLKLLSVLEGLVAIVLMYWLGREVIGTHDPRLGRLTGLLLAGLVAVSYWHTVLSRMGLRIVLTTGITALLLVFLARAMRYNRRVDYIKAGLVLGFGLYMYQAVRMLPVVVIVGGGLAFLFNARSWWDRGRYAVNFAVLVLVSAVIFAPLFGFWMEYPEDFWRRTSGRLLGDDIITTVDENGTITERQATLGERFDAFSDNLPILANNIRTALLMFNWKGDVAWINGAPNQPTLDTFSGALLIVGLAAWLARMVRRRDVFDWLVPLALLIMLLPSALSIAYPIENPSHTRTSGALPSVYLIAALPLALLVHSLTQLIRGWRGVLAGVLLVAVVLAGSYYINAGKYFGEHTRQYIESSFPYSEAGRVLRGFAESDGSYGNAFMLAYPYWWDHRAIAIEAGQLRWPNGVVSLENLPTMMYTAYERSDIYRLDPERDLLFFLSSADEDSLAWLEQNFPDGRAMLRQSYQHDDQYTLYRVPALGEIGLLTWIGQHDKDASQ